MRIVSSLASIAALVGGLALLLADDAEPACKIADFDRTFTVASTCGPFSETVRITVDGEGMGTSTEAVVEHVAGDVAVSGALLQGACKNDGEAIAYDGFVVDLAVTPPDRPAVAHTCILDPDTLVVERCYETVANIDTICTITFTAN